MLLGFIFDMHLVQFFFSSNWSMMFATDDRDVLIDSCSLGACLSSPNWAHWEEPDEEYQFGYDVRC